MRISVSFLRQMRTERYLLYLFMTHDTRWRLKGRFLADDNACSCAGRYYIVCRKS
jgi:hypothetical protein